MNLPRRRKSSFDRIILMSGILLAGLGGVLNPAFVVKHFRPQGIHAHSTILEIYAAQVFLVAVGAAMSLYAVLQMKDIPFAQKIDRMLTAEHAVFVGLTVALVGIVLPFLTYDAHRIVYTAPIGPFEYNEGWNAFHTSRLLHSGARYLYPMPTAFPVTPLNYPPLWFVIGGAITALTGDVVLAGRFIALSSFLLVGALVFATIERITARRMAGVLGAALWMGLMVRLADSYVGLDDPQMLGHVFTGGAIYLYVRWRSELTLRRIWALAILCSLALFVKHLLVAVPCTLALTLAVRDRRSFATFALAGASAFSALILGSLLSFGGNFLANALIDTGRAWSSSRMIQLSGPLMFGHGAIALLAAFAILLWLRPRNDLIIVLVYFPVSAVIGSYAMGWAGLDVNAWFDFFIAASMVAGVLAAELPRASAPGIRGAVAGILAICIVPVIVGIRMHLDAVLNHGWLEHAEQRFQKEVEILRSIPGPALFEEPLLGFAAGKPFLFDPFLGTQLIISGRLPERELVDRIRGKYFNAIVLDFDLERALSALRRRGGDLSNPSISATSRWTERWTDNALLAIGEHYVPRTTPELDYFFYLPKTP